MSEATKVLSVMTPVLGNLTYGNLFKKYLAELVDTNVVFQWFTDERRLLDRLLVRPLWVSFPSPWIRKQNLDFRKLRTELGSSYITKCLIERKMRHDNYSLLHIHTQSISLLMLKTMAKVPTVVSLDTTAVLAAQEATDPAYRWTYQPTIALEQKVFDAAATVVTFSEHARLSVIRDYGIMEEKVKCIYPGVDIDFLTGAFRKDSPPVGSGLCKLLFIGGDFGRKGGFDLLEVFLEQFADVAELHLVTQVDVECDHPNVHIYRDIQAYTEPWLDLYRMADVFVMPSRAEALGHVFVEAMAVGLPVIACRLPATSEMVVHGKTGFLTEVGDREDLARHLGFLIGNPELRRSMGIDGAARAGELFDARKNFHALCGLWDELIGRSDRNLANV
jgi:alpha-maltose-1-phosphate synthase